MTRPGGRSSSSFARGSSLGRRDRCGPAGQPAGGLAAPARPEGGGAGSPSGANETRRLYRLDPNGLGELRSLRGGGTGRKRSPPSRRRPSARGGLHEHASARPDRPQERRRRLLPPSMPSKTFTARIYELVAVHSRTRFFWGRPESAIVRACASAAASVHQVGLGRQGARSGRRCSRGNRPFAVRRRPGIGSERTTVGPELEVRFRCPRVTGLGSSLEHRGWERYGDQAAEAARPATRAAGTSCSRRSWDATD